ncbi:MAG: low affinity iron permease family protein [Chlamydiales bacterium]|nr:low affinity iron permease family protein [Chlamydiales bacterium]
MFSKISTFLSGVLGNPWSFILAALFVIAWAVLGPIFNYSENWQLVINTSTTIITFLMVFIIQNSQNRDTMAIQLKLDELIRAMEGAHCSMVNIEQLPDDQLKELHKRYEALSSNIQKHIEKGEVDTGAPEIK